jgi:hypothetical protein
MTRLTVSHGEFAPVGDRHREVFAHSRVNGSEQALLVEDGSSELLHVGGL